MTELLIRELVEKDVEECVEMTVTSLSLDRIWIEKGKC